jgi:RNA polymerase sigma factor (sigma-70 family)
MDTSLPFRSAVDEQNRAITEAVARENARLRKFIRRRVANPVDAEDVLQDVLYEVTRAYRLPEPIEQIGAWMYRVALNRMTDLFRRKKPALLEDILAGDGRELSIDDLLPASDSGPEEAYARAVLMEEVCAALDELPSAQRDVFIAHELEGRSFKELAEASGLTVNTLLSRKRYAVLRLRARLQAIYDELDLIER